MKGMDLASALAAPVQGRGSGQGARSRSEAGNTDAESFDTVFNDVHGVADAAPRQTDDAGADSAVDGAAARRRLWFGRCAEPCGCRREGRRGLCRVRGAGCRASRRARRRCPRGPADTADSGPRSPRAGRPSAVSGPRDCGGNPRARPPACRAGSAVGRDLAAGCPPGRSAGDGADIRSAARHRPSGHWPCCRSALVRPARRRGSARGQQHRPGLHHAGVRS